MGYRTADVERPHGPHCLAVSSLYPFYPTVSHHACQLTNWRGESLAEQARHVCGLAVLCCGGEVVMMSLLRAPTFKLGALRNGGWGLVLARLNFGVIGANFTSDVALVR